MNIIKECNRQDYMHSSCLDNFEGEDVIVEGDGVIYLASIALVTSGILYFQPKQRWSNQYGLGGRTLYVVVGDDGSLNSPTWNRTTGTYMAGDISMHSGDMYHTNLSVAHDCVLEEVHVDSGGWIIEEV